MSASDGIVLMWKVMASNSWSPNEELYTVTYIHVIFCHFTYPDEVSHVYTHTEDFTCAHVQAATWRKCSLAEYIFLQTHTHTGIYTQWQAQAHHLRTHTYTLWNTHVHIHKYTQWNTHLLSNTYAMHSHILHSPWHHHSIQLYTLYKPILQLKD